MLGAGLCPHVCLLCCCNPGHEARPRRPGRGVVPSPLCGVSVTRTAESPVGGLQSQSDRNDLQEVSRLSALELGPGGRPPPGRAAVVRNLQVLRGRSGCRWAPGTVCARTPARGCAAKHGHPQPRPRGQRHVQGAAAGSAEGRAGSLRDTTLLSQAVRGGQFCSEIRKKPWRVRVPRRSLEHDLWVALMLGEPGCEDRPRPAE